MTASRQPGAPDIPQTLARELEAALAKKGPGYQPRTHHFEGGADAGAAHAGGADSGAQGRRPKYLNRLILEASPYLLQHAHNPVDWRPWGEEAFEEARRRGVPVFLSIGYSTCHWCHVMEGETFEDEAIARVMNEHFVCIKVDREERPDVDAVYMSAVQRLTGGGGWPMSVWLTPDREPFFGGTYFPPRAGARGARRGFLELITELSRTYQQDRSRTADAAAALVAAVRADLEGHGTETAAGAVSPTPSSILATVESLKLAFDETHGGLRRAPKFPSSLPVRLLLRVARRTGDQELLRMATLTLEKMAAGGLYDQIGGGFHRYSTDVQWLVPHFEKMLYDNGLLVVAYVEAFQATGRADFARVARETLDYLLREMTAPGGGFYSATDADSEGEEGKFFVWSEAEVRAVLGAEADRFIRHYGVTRAGNFEGANILNVPRPDEPEHAALAPARAKLYEARKKRIPPLRDDKILASWNGLAISAFARAGFVLDEPRYTEAARRAAEFILTKMRASDGRLRRSHHEGAARGNGFLDDHAFVAAGLFDLFEATFDPRWLTEALALARTTDALFGDAKHGGWFMTSGDHEKLLAREKPDYDGAEPSGTSVALLNALRLHTATGDETLRASAEKAFGAMAPVLRERPMVVAEALLALDYLLDVPREIAVVWKPGEHAAAAPLLAKLRGTFLPNRVVAGAAEGAELAALAKTVPWLAEKLSQGGRATAYVCEHGRCEAPTGDPDVLAKQIGKTRPYGR